MNTHATALVRLTVCSMWLAALWTTKAEAVDWLTRPSTYTHSPATGERLSQFAQVDAPPMVDQSSLIVSGYTHYRSTIQFGQSADNYHRVNQWGPPVRPYGEWRFPFRPYSVPYSEWGAPFAGLNIGGFVPPYPPFSGYPGQGIPGQGYPGQGYPGQGYPGQGFPGQGFPGQGLPGQGQPGWGQPGMGTPGGGWPSGGIPGQPFNPYPANPNGPYPVPPWYDGFHPDYPVGPPPMSDQEFFAKPGD